MTGLFLIPRLILQIKNPIEISNNEKPDDEIQFFENLSEVETEENDLLVPTQNSLPILYEHSKGLQTAIQNGPFSINDFRLCSDSYIANVFLSIKLEKKDSQWAESLKYSNYNPKHYGIYVYAGRSALEVEVETELKKQLLLQSKMSEPELKKLIYGH